jgi:hypothetical protein
MGLHLHKNHKKQHPKESKNDELGGQSPAGLVIKRLRDLLVS